MAHDHTTAEELNVLPQEEEPRDEVYDFLNFAEIPTPVHLLDDTTSPRQPATILASPSCFFKSPVRSTTSNQDHQNQHQHHHQHHHHHNNNKMTKDKAISASATLGATKMTPVSVAKSAKKQLLRIEVKTPEALSWTGSSDLLSPTRLALISAKSDTLDDELGGEPSSGSTSTNSDAFFSFLHPFSPLESADDFETGLLPLRLSPLLPITSSELPRLMPPFPFPKLGDSPRPKDSNKTPNKQQDPSNSSSGSSSSSSLSSSSSSTTSPSTLSTPSPATELANAYPRIQASTSATPGHEERSKLSASARTMKLQFSEHSEAFPKREMQFINSSLKRKCQSRKRKFASAAAAAAAGAAGSNDSGCPRASFGGPTNVQRKLLQTPKKIHLSSTSSPRSPLRAGSLTANFSPGLEQHESASSGLGPDEKLGAAWRVQHRSESSCFHASSSSASPLLHDQDFPKAPANTPVKTPTSHSTGIPVAGISPLGEVPNNPVKRANGCNCKKSKCLKLYCECFARGGYCDENCRCLDCANTKSNETLRQQAMKQRLEKNPNAFKPKIESAACFDPTTTATLKATSSIGYDPSSASMNSSSSSSLSLPSSSLSSSSSSSSALHGGDRNLHPGRNGLVTTTTALVPSGSPAAPGANHQVKKMHKHGCHCKKSACRKKYCECYQAGVPCGDNCRCIECRNQPASAQVPTPFSPTDQEMFVSPLGVRRLRIDRETWARNFSSPFEFSPRHTQERERQFRLKLKSVRAFAKSANLTSVEEAHAGPSRFHRDREHLRNEAINQTGATTATPLKVLTRFQVQSQRRIGDTRAAVSSSSSLSLSSSSLCSSSSSSCSSARSRAKHKLVYPLFGDDLPPLKGDLCANIFQCLSNSDLYNASLVNHLWSRMTLGESVWDHENFIQKDDVEDVEDVGDA